jgi:serine protease Do
MHLLRLPYTTSAIALALLLSAAPFGHADSPKTPTLADISDQVNQRMVKLFGQGGFRGTTSYGTGIVVSPDGFVLTATSPMLDTAELTVHLWDGRRVKARVLVQEPELDAALVKIEKIEDLPYFDIAKAAKGAQAQPGDWVLAFSNQFEIATRDEPMTVQHGVISAKIKLRGRRGIFEVPYDGEVYVLDAITNNPGAAGGAVTTRKGELIGLVGKELKNALTDTWINYAVPIQVVADFVEKAKKGDYKVVVKTKTITGPAAFHGLILVPNVVERTPPFVEDTLPGSPAARAGLRPDDLIIYVNDEKITSIKEFKDIVDKGKPGDEFKLEVRRGDKLTTVKLKLEPLPTAKR